MHLFGLYFVSSCIMKKTILIIALSICACLASAQGLFKTNTEKASPVPPKVPASITFAGQVVELNRSDLIERMDREILSFAYSHQNSILILKRSEKFFRRIVPILKEQRLPEDLKYVMVIESNLDPKAYSSAGAAGLWQFTKTTASEFGLEINSEVDERYNIEKETIAACKFLKKAYEKYNDWMTVAASYNSGQGGTSGRLNAQKQKSALNLWQPTETSRYMFRLLAVKMLFENPSAFGFDVKESDKYPYYEPEQVVEVNTPIVNLVDFAEKYCVSYMQLKEANLWLRSDHLTNKAHKTYKIIIPQNK